MVEIVTQDGRLRHVDADYEPELWAVRGGGGRRQTTEAQVRLLYAEHGHSLLAYATRLTGDRAAAEDVVQETLVRAWKKADDLAAGSGSVRGWLLTVARNIITDRARARAIRPAEVAAVDNRSPVEGDHSEAVVNTMVVMEALVQLSPKHREVVVALYYRGHSVTEAAKELGVPPGTVKSRAYYALRALRAEIGASGAEVAR